MSDDESDSDELERLLGRAKSGDQLALGELLQRHRDFLKRLAGDLQPKVLVRVDGSDIAQKAQLAAFESFASFQGTSVAQFREWCRRIVEHDILQVLEREKYTAKRSIDRETDAPSEVAQAVGRQTSPSQRAVRNEHQAILRQAIEDLEEPIRAVMTLKHLQDVTLDEIVQQVGLSKREVSVLLHQGMKRLKAYLKQRGFTNE